MDDALAALTVSGLLPSAVQKHRPVDESRAGSGLAGFRRGHVPKRSTKVTWTYTLGMCWTREERRQRPLARAHTNILVLCTLPSEAHTHTRIPHAQSRPLRSAAYSVLTRKTLPRSLRTAYTMPPSGRGERLHSYTVLLVLCSHVRHLQLQLPARARGTESLVRAVRHSTHRVRTLPSIAGVVPNCGLCVFRLHVN